MMTTQKSWKIWNEIGKVIYGCDLNKATLLPDYELAAKIVEEIKTRKGEIQFENGNIIEQIMNEGEGIQFDTEALKVYELVPTERIEL